MKKKIDGRDDFVIQVDACGSMFSINISIIVLSRAHNYSNAMEIFLSSVFINYLDLLLKNSLIIRKTKAFGNGSYPDNKF